VRSIVLTGFMGTGKTSVGRRVAQKLGREFIDLDTLIETRTGKTICEIFATEGEAYFRRLEAHVCAELGARENLVIATGGGALVSSQNRAAFATAFVICLDASVDEIIARIGNATDRPMLAGDARQRIETLMRKRADAYAQIQTHVDTTHKSVEQVADEIIAMMETNVPIVVTTPEGSYPIWVGNHLFDRLVNLEMPGDCVIITHPHLRTLYAGRIAQTLQAHQIQAHVIEIPVGEEIKTLDTVRRVYDQLIDAHLDRQTTIVALGGGVVGDLAGFVAATYLRGVALVQMPTTLLAMVDASIGGKVAVDHPRGKNLIGAFKQPRAVIADVATLSSLPAVEWRAGMAEVVKHGIIGDATLFEELESWKLEVGSWRLEVGLPARFE
jgi:shikimate kinase/3-dehydroquinate synthase